VFNACVTLTSHVCVHVACAQVGCAIWIGGCIAFLLPIAAQLCKDVKQVTPWLQAFCQLSFLAGCTMSFFGSTDADMQLLSPTANALFTAASVTLLVDVGQTWWFRVRASKQKCYRLRGIEMLNLAIGFAFTYASAAGGFGRRADVISSGVYFWMVGSVLLLLEPINSLAGRLHRSGFGGFNRDRGKHMPERATTRSQSEMDINPRESRSRTGSNSSSLVPWTTREIGYGV